MNEYFDELLLCARYNDFEDLVAYFSHFTPTQIEQVVVMRDERGNGILHFAAANGHTKVIEHITSLSTAGLDILNESGNSALHWASLNGHIACVKELIQRGSKWDIKNSSGRTAMDEAESRGHKDVVLFLLALVPDSEIDKVGKNETKQVEDEEEMDEMDEMDELD